MHLLSWEGLPLGAMLDGSMLPLGHFAHISYFYKFMVLVHPINIKVEFFHNFPVSVWKSLPLQENVVSSGTLSLLGVTSCHSWMDAHPHDFHNCSFQELGPVHPQPQSPTISFPLPTGSYLRLQLLPYISGVAKPVWMLFLQVSFMSLIFRHKEFLNCSTNHPPAPSCTPASHSAPSKTPARIPTEFSSPVLFPPTPKWG